MTKDRIALVLGATGGIGGDTARALIRHGWRVRALHRDPARAARNAARLGATRLGATRPGATSLGAIEWVAGDAMREADVVAAAQGVDVIVHAVNPPGYRKWSELVLPMLASSLAAAKASGARIVLPGTVYNYGPDAFPLLREEAPQNPLTRKGKIRVEMEQRLRAAAQDGVRTLIVRAGDFFGPDAGNNWFCQGLVKPGKPVRSVQYPGRPGIGHAWAYLPDIAETIAQLLDREGELADFDTFHFGGHWFDDGIEIARSIQRVAGMPRPPIRQFPWWLAIAASPFVTVFRELLEMRYLWRTPVRLDNAKLVAFLGAEPHTPLDTAVAATLAGLGCLPDAAPNKAANALSQVIA
jgi:nucleoside-diphosphate-sugar epimerase